MLSQVGGIPGVLKYLLSKGLLHGECLTVTGEQLQALLKLPSLLCIASTWLASADSSLPCSQALAILSL